MRLLALTSLLVLAACSEGEEPAQQKAEAPAATELAAGQWEVTHEVTSLTQRDQGTPAIKAEQGSTATTTSCVAPADVKKPQGALFAPEGMECSNREMYMRGGRINATLACTQPGLSGNIATLVNGTYTADSIDGTAVTETSLLGEGDVKIESKISGKRVGECTAAEPAAATN